MDILLSAKLGGALLVASLLFGLWLSRRGRPLSTALLSAHKLLSLAAAGMTVATLLQRNRDVPLEPMTWGVAIAAGVLFVGAVASGGILSGERPAPRAILRVHQIAALFVALCGAATLVLLVAR